MEDPFPARIQNGEEGAFIENNQTVQAGEFEYLGLNFVIEMC